MAGVSDADVDGDSVFGEERSDDKRSTEREMHGLNFCMYCDRRRFYYYIEIWFRSLILELTHYRGGPL